jgi:hypothetical protein
VSGYTKNGAKAFVESNFALANDFAEKIKTSARSNTLKALVIKGCDFDADNVMNLVNFALWITVCKYTFKKRIPNVT